MSDTRDVLNELKTWGADPTDATSRVLGDEALYRRLLTEFADNSDMELLQLLLRQKNYTEAFRIAHSMKGASVSLGLDPLSESLSGLVDILRPYYESCRYPEPSGETHTGREDSSCSGKTHADREDDSFSGETHAGRTDDSFSGPALPEAGQIRICLKHIDEIWAAYCRIVL